LIQLTFFFFVTIVNKYLYNILVNHNTDIVEDSVKSGIPVICAVLILVSVFSGCLGGEENSQKNIISPKNLDPVALISTTGTYNSLPGISSDDSIDVFAYEGDSIMFDASDSYDPDGSIISYHWIFHDNTDSNGSTTSQVFTLRDSSYQDELARFSITLEVEDSNHSISFLLFTIGVIPKQYLFYLDSGGLVESNPSAHFDSLTATKGTLRPVETMIFSLPESIRLQACRWNATILVKKTGFSFIRMISLTLKNTSGMIIAESSQSFTLFEIRREKQIKMNGFISESVDFQSIEIQVTGFSLKNKIQIHQGGENPSMIFFDFGSL